MKHVATCVTSRAPPPTFKCDKCERTFVRLDLLRKHEASSTKVCKGKVSSPPKKRGRPFKVVEPATDSDCPPAPKRKKSSVKKNKDRDVLFNQLKSSFENDRFVMTPTAKGGAGGGETAAAVDQPTVVFKTDAELAGNVIKILENLFDETVLRGLGWPDANVDVILDTILQSLDLKPANRTECAEYGVRLRDNMMKLFAKFIGKDEMEAMQNNYTTDQMLQHVVDTLVNG